MSEDESLEAALSPQERRQLAAVLEAVILFCRVHRRISHSQMNTFLQVAIQQNLTVSPLAARCGISAAVMSRHLGDLGAFNRRREPGLGLVAMVQQAHGDRRERRVILTDRGAALVREVNLAMRGEGPMARQTRKRT